MENKLTFKKLLKYSYIRFAILGVIAVGILMLSSLNIGILFVGGLLIIGLLFLIAEGIALLILPQSKVMAICVIWLPMFLPIFYLLAFMSSTSNEGLSGVAGAVMGIFGFILLSPIAVVNFIESLEISRG